MSQMNIDVVLASIDAFNAGDLDAQMATYAPDAVVTVDPALDVGGIEERIVGLEVLRHTVRANLQDFWGGRYKATDVRAVGEHQVLCRGEWGGVGAASGIELYVSLSVLFTLRNGLIAGAEFYRDHSEALKAAGLEKQGVSSNVDLVRSIYAHWERGDFGVTSWAHPGLEFVIVGGLGGAHEPRRGLKETAQLWREFLEDWHDFAAVPESYRELDRERVIVFHHFGGRGKRSGVEVGPTESRGACLFHVAGGKVSKLVLYPVRDRALADLGLAPGG
jgi:ketosteroid isomerase-like protein